MLVAGLPSYGTTNKNPDFAAVARPSGRTGCGWRSPSSCDGALNGRLQAQGPGARRRRHRPERALHAAEGHDRQAKGFALAMTKMAFAGELDDVTDTVMSNWRLFP